MQAQVPRRSARLIIYLNGVANGMECAWQLAAPSAVVHGSWLIRRRFEPTAAQHGVQVSHRVVVPCVRACAMRWLGVVRAQPATGRPMGMRVLGSRKWSRPGKVGAGCDALVLRLHATHAHAHAHVHAHVHVHAHAHVHVGGCRSARLCRDESKGWRNVGRRHLVLNIRLASRVPSKQRDESSMVPLRRSQRARTD